MKKGGYKTRGNVIYVYGTVDGKHYRLSTGKEATKLNLAWIKHNHQDVLLKLIDKQKYSQPKSLNVVEYGKSVLESDEYSRKGSTNRAYRIIFNSHVSSYFKNYSLQDITAMGIKNWQSKLLLKGLSHKSVKIARAILKSILESAIADRIISVSPMNNVKPPKAHKESKETVPFSFDEVKENAIGYFKSFLAVALFTGVRTGELRALKWEDIDFRAKKIYIKRTNNAGVETLPKTGKSRIIDMLPIVEYELEE